MSTILVVDDERDVLEVAARSLESEGYIVEKATNGRAAMEKLKERNFDLVISDLIMEGIDGIDVLKYVKKSHPSIPVMIVTASHEVNLAVEAINQGVDAYLIKPFELNEFFHEVWRCLNRAEREKSARDNTACPYCEETRELIIMASHDLRSSLVSLGAAIKLLEKSLNGPGGHNASQMVRELHKKVKTTLHIAEDFLCRASFLHQTLGTDREVVELKSEVILPTLSEISYELRDICGNGTKAVSVFSENGLYVEGHRVWLRAAFRNLLMNAIKYGTGGGQVVLSYEDACSRHQISIFNSGTQIPEESLTKIFKPFATVDCMSCGRGASLGLGLYFVRKIIEKHGGRIWYEAAKGGSKFVFSLPKFFNV